jgi:hypothetical protein
MPAPAVCVDVGVGEHRVVDLVWFGPFIRAFGQELEEERLDGCGHVGADGSDWRGRGVHVMPLDGDAVVGCEGRLACEHLVQNAMHDAYRQREAVFAAVMADRQQWEQATRQQRQLAVADAELHRRHPGQQFPPLRSAEPESATQQERKELTLTAGNDIRNSASGSATWPRTTAPLPTGWLNGSA